MSITVVDTSQQLFDYRQRVSFDGVTFGLRFRWNTRSQSWFVDVFDEDGNVVVYARKCVIEWTLLRQSRHIANVPAGELINIDTTNRDAPPGRVDFGTRVLMMYLDASELEAV
jgi:hypothetical protein